MTVTTASRAPHGKHGTTFAETVHLRDGTHLVAVGQVIAGNDRIAVADLLRSGVRALITSRALLPGAIATLERVVEHHARDHRDDALAAVVALIAIRPGDDHLDFVGAGQLHCAIVDSGFAERERLHGRGAALGAGVAAPHDGASIAHRVHRHDAILASTVAFDPALLGAANAETILERAGANDASVALIQVD
ncbi:hypothetical protein WPS_01170 [Vulcanimicrobium alpinum]|uniref:Uncharacterized protein n=1 Tax=Vulcanimicrobium alpinum TaxID=3016050 RepID=A0AAN2C8A5_UNVUL|nr:SpoIIE family protein phosphatase [Vulcanimicrobium alpinum]BDE04841.1 hypothetical protein WPS_01170 [Vulcanimicrobium alpinum]